MQTAAGTFTRGDGTTGSSGEFTSTAGNLDLLVNTFHRQFTDFVTLTDQARLLPDLYGSGQVRDLSEAISLSPDLGNLIELYMGQTNRQGQIDLLDEVISGWAETSTFKPLALQALELAASGVSVTYHLDGLTPGSSEFTAFIERLGVVERFMGFTYGGPAGQARFEPLAPSAGHLSVTLAREQVANISLAYERFKTDIYESLLFDARHFEYLRNIGVASTNGEFQYSFDSVEQAFRDAIAANAQNGILDLIEFVSAAGEARLMGLGWNAMSFLESEISKAQGLSAFSEELSSWTVTIAGAASNLTGTARPDLLVGGQANDQLSGGIGNDILIGGAGNDTLYGEGGNDRLDGSAGNDRLEGSAGNDTYLFGRGSGQDTITENDTVAGKIDAVEFAADVLPSDILMSRSGDDVVLAIAGTTDKLTLQYYLWQDGSSGYKVEEIRFANGIVWDVATVKARLLQGSEAGETLYGYSADATIDGGGGNDTIYGRAGNDALLGGAGNDTIHGEAGDDRLDGGTGHDQLEGGAGNDTYIFRRGSGQDTVTGNDTTNGKIDVVEFAADILPSDIVVSRSGDDVVLTIAGTTDKLTLQYYLWQDGTSGYKVEQVRFADGTVWDVAAIRLKLLQGTEVADTINGFSGNDTINGAGGNDNLYGLAGNDRLDGGAGNDGLDGGPGNDVYVFGRGSGQDTISVNDTTAGKVDAVEFAADISPTDVLVSRSGDDVILAIAGTTDKLTIQYYLWQDGTSGYKVEQIRFADGTVWDVATVKSKLVRGTEAADMITGNGGDETIDGLGGNDTIYGRNGNDILLGGAGNDSLYGEAGNDRFDGGAGYDRLEGGTGNDVYVFGRGSGEDTIGGSDTTAGKIDAVEFAVDILPSDILVSRSGDHVILSIAGTADKLTLEYYLYLEGNSGYKVEQIRFASGTVWDVVAVKLKLLQGTEAADTINGFSGNDSINGAGGNDTLYGLAGNDRLDGGAGNDSLTGGAGNDVYLFGRGSGQDTVTGSDSTAGKIDAVEFAADILSSDILVSRSGEHVIPEHRRHQRQADAGVLPVSGMGRAATRSSRFASPTAPFGT